MSNIHIYVATFLIKTVSGSIDWSAIETPPQFVHDKNADTVYFKVEKSGMSDESAKNTPGNLLEQTIHCYANGNPRPS